MLGFAGMMFAVAGCQDATLPATSAPDLPSADVLIGEDYQSPACCDEVVVIVPGPTEPVCDPYTDANWCQDSGGECMQGEESYSTSGCSSSGPGGGTEATCPTTDPACTGGGGESGTPSDPDEDCNPQYDPDCNQPLSSADSATLQIAKQRHLKPASAFTDPAAAQKCAEMMAEFDRLFAAGRVFRGGADTPEGDPLTPTHVGAFDLVAGTMHFEPSALDAANRGDAAAIRSLFNTALHEAAHSLGFDHTEPVMSGDYDLYAEQPFNLLSPGTNSCIAG